MNKRTLLFIVSLVSMAVSAAVLVLLIPSLFRPGEQIDIWLIAGLVVLVVALASGARRWRPPTPVSNDR
jgi:hypothetical protein